MSDEAANDPPLPPSMPCWTAQHIGVAWVESKGQIGSADVTFKAVEHFARGESIDFRLQHVAAPNGAVLRCIDGCGDTLLNYLQVHALIAELMEIKGRITEPDLIAHLEALLEFAGREKPPQASENFVGLSTLRPQA